MGSDGPDSRAVRAGEALLAPLASWLGEEPAEAAGRELVAWLMQLPGISNVPVACLPSRQRLQRPW